MSRFPYTPAATLNPDEDYRKIRRIIAEDPGWSLAIVPCLSNLCLQSIVRNFEGMHLFFCTIIIYIIINVYTFTCNINGTYKT